MYNGHICNWRPISGTPQKDEQLEIIFDTECVKTSLFYFLSNPLNKLIHFTVGLTREPLWCISIRNLLNLKLYTDKLLFMQNLKTPSMSFIHHFVYFGHWMSMCIAGTIIYTLYIYIYLTDVFYNLAVTIMFNPHLTAPVSRWAGKPFPIGNIQALKETSSLSAATPRENSV